MPGQPSLSWPSMEDLLLFTSQRVALGLQHCARSEELKAPHIQDQEAENQEQGWLGQACPQWTQFISQPSDFMKVYPLKVAPHESWGEGGSVDKASSY